MKPKSPKDCQECQKSKTIETIISKPMPVPWSQKKGQGGRKKTISSQNYFCSNPECEYYLIADEQIHALVAYGHHGKYEEIRDLKCQACGKKFTIRKHTVLYQLKTHSKVVCLVLSLLALGMDISALEQALEIRESTLRTWPSRIGEHGNKLHEQFMIGLELFHLQLDELYGYVKQAGHEIWVWTVVDAKTKLMPVLQIGPRTQAMAYGVVHELNSRLKAGCVPVFSSDGLMHYFYALTAHFGEWIDVEGQGKPVWMVLESFFYAQVVKCQRRFRLVSVEHKVIWGMPSEYAQRLKTWGLSGRINTSFVERANLTIRRCVSKLMRRTWGTAQYPTELGEHLSWWLAYYHFARYHESLRTKLDQPMARKGKQLPKQYRRRTPTMAAGVTTKRWSVLELISYPLP